MASSSLDRDRFSSSPKRSGTVICFAEVYSIHVIFVNIVNIPLFRTSL